MAVAGDNDNIPPDQVPAKAMATLKKLAGTAEITEIEREKEHGLVIYEAEWSVNGKEKEAAVTADGDLVEMEEEIDASALPPKVKEVVAKEFPAAADIEYEKVMVVLYEIEGKVKGKEKEILVMATGKIVKEEEEDDDDEDDGEDEEEISLDQVPAAVKATILAEAKGAPIKEVERETEDGKTVYEAEWNVGEMEVEIKVAPDGTLLKKEIEEEDDDDDDDN
jgi:uncharacterized membrane protein YkoI